MSDRRPAACYDPREYVRDELTERDIAEGHMPPTVRLWLDGDTEMTMTVAQTLFGWLGGHWEYWLDLDAAWRRWKEQRDE